MSDDDDSGDDSGDDIRQIKDSKIFELCFSDFYDINTILRTVGDRDWHLKLRTRSISGIRYLELHLMPILRLGRRPRYPLKKWQYLLCLVNEDPSKNVETIDKNCEATGVSYWKFVRLDKILAENSGFLIGGKLRVRVEIRVLTFIEASTGLSMFNFCDPFENCVTINTLDVPLYANKRVMMTHCERLRNRILDGQTPFSVSDSYLSWGNVHDVLQCIHGFLGFRHSGLAFQKELFRLSDHWGIPIQHWYQERLYNKNYARADEVIYLNRHMKNKLQAFANLNKLKNHAWHFTLSKLNEETMKAITQKFFSFAIDAKIARVKRVKTLQKLREIVEKWDLDNLELRVMVKVAGSFFSYCYNVEGAKSWEELQKQTRRWNIEELNRNIIKKIIDKCFFFAVDYRAVALALNDL